MKTIRFLLLTLACLAGAIGLYGYESSSSSAKGWDNAPLQKMFLAQDDEYFGGRLPKNTIVRWVDIPVDNGQDVMGTEEYFSASNSYEIDIDTKTNITMSTAYATLEHEECHVANEVDGAMDQEPHGPAFQKCMTDLANEGAMKGIW